VKNSKAASRRSTVLLAVAVSAIVGMSARASADMHTLPRDPGQTYVTVDAATGSVISVTNHQPRIDYAESYRGDSFPVFGWWKTDIS
jgi:hypothetical protein